MKSTRIIGREEELRTMERIYQSDKSEMLAIYGRRRVGKSFLVEEAFRGKICFSTVGVYKKLEDGKDEMKQAQTHKESQLLHFYDDLIASVQKISQLLPHDTIILPGHDQRTTL